MKHSLSILILSILVAFVAKSQKIKDYDVKFPFDKGYEIMQKNGLFGLVTEDGQFVTTIKYTQIYYFTEKGYAKVEINDSMGYIDQNGKEVIPCIYQDIYEKYASISKPKYEIIDGKEYEYIQAIFTPIIKDDLVLVQKGDKLGFYDIKQGKERIPTKYDWIRGVLDDNIGNEDDPVWNYIYNPENSKPQDLKIDPFYYAFFDQGLCAMIKGSKKGFVDENGKEITAFVYDGYVNYFRDQKPCFVNDQGNIIVIKNKKAGLIDKNGKQIVAADYDVVYKDDKYLYFVNGLAKVYQNNKVGFVNEKGILVINAIYDFDNDCEDCNSFDFGVAKVKLGNDFLLIDQSGKTIITEKFQDVKILGTQWAIGKISGTGKIVFIDLNAKKTVADPEFLANIKSLDQLYLFTEDDLALVENNKNEYLAIDQKLKVKTTFSIDEGFLPYDFNGDYCNIGFHGDMIAFVDGKKNIHYLDAKGTEIVKLFAKQLVGTFAEGMTYVVDDQSISFLDNKGQLTFSTDYVFDYPNDYPVYGREFNQADLKFEDGLFPVKKKGKYGYIDTKGDKIITTKFDCAFPFHEGEATVIYKGFERKIDKKGEFIGASKERYFDVGEENIILDSVKSRTGQFENYISLKIGAEYHSLYLDQAKIPLKYFTALDRTHGTHKVILYEDYRMEKVIGAFFINNEGEVMDNHIYENATDFENNLAGVKQNGKWSFVDENFETKIEGPFDSVQKFIDGFAAVKHNDKWQIIDSKGNIVRNGYPRDILDVQYIVDVVYYGNKIPPDPYLDKTFVSKRKTFLDVEFPIPDYALTEELNLIGFKGIENSYNEKGKMGYLYIRKNRMLAFPYYFVNAGKFFNNLARVQNSYGKIGYINKEGKEVIPIIFDETSSLHFKDNNTNVLRTYVWVKLDGKYGAYQPDGTVILEPVYDKIYDEYLTENASFFKGMAHYQFILVEKDGKKSYINLQGKCVKGCD